MTVISYNYIELLMGIMYQFIPPGGELAGGNCALWDGYLVCHLKFRYPAW